MKLQTGPRKAAERVAAVPHRASVTFPAACGSEAPADHHSRPDRVWDVITDDVRKPNHRPGAGTPRTVAAGAGLAVHRRAQVFCFGGLGLLKPRDLTTGPAGVVIKAAKNSGTRPPPSTSSRRPTPLIASITGRG
jgi:hypothetical protein